MIKILQHKFARKKQGWIKDYLTGVSKCMMGGGNGDGDGGGAI